MINLWENLKLAFAAIWANKLRSFLTMLGVVIGVFVIIILIGIGQSIKSEITKQVEGLGSNLLVILPGKIEKGAFSGGMISESTLTLDDAKKVESIEDVESASPLMFVNAQVSYNNQLAKGIFVVGSNPAIKDTVEGDLTKGPSLGDFFTEEDYKNKAKKAFIFTGLKNQFFPNENPVGKKIMINRMEFEICGFLKTQAEGIMGQQSEFENMIFIPLTTAQEINKSNKIQRIAIKVSHADKVEETKEEIKKVLLEAHGGLEDFTIFTQEEILDMFNDILSLLTNVLVTLAAISLVVGGIGIMNILLVSVTERTREIGLRKAVGATNGAILFQFLVEAVILSLLGGIFGIILARLGSLIINYKFGFEPIINLYAIVVAIGFSLIVGIIFGVAPALRASRLKPIDALRYE